MNDAYDAPPRNLRSLRDRLTYVSKRDGLVFGRLQRHVGALVAAQFVVSVVDSNGVPAVFVKGGTAIELRRGISDSRASKDIDVVTREDIEILCAQISDAAAKGWQGFSATLTTPEVIDVPGLAIKPRRLTIKIRYHGSNFVSLPLEISPPEAGNVDSLEWTQSQALELVGLAIPSPIPCMTIDWQIAQKLHAVTAVLHDGRRNDRAHDLVDLQILEALVTEEQTREVKVACLEVFRSRSQQEWPPSVTVYPHWERIYLTAVQSVSHLQLANDVHQAAKVVSNFIARIESSG